jgi:hypothetical protein
MNTYTLQVVQQTLGHQVSQPVAQIIAGFSKVFVGEIVEKGLFGLNPHQEFSDFFCSPCSTDTSGRKWASLTRSFAGSISGIPG